jgi:hypothetical protein
MDGSTDRRVSEIGVSEIGASEIGASVIGVSVIGLCVVASCDRPAVTHLVVDVDGNQLLGSVCEHCERATRSAAFLLGLAA